VKRIVWTRHAKDVCTERDIAEEAVSRALLSPEWREPDARTPGAERRFLSLPERDGRVLRVVCFETETEIRVLTAFLDRRARRP
jgi:hypothetical protein